VPGSPPPPLPEVMSGGRLRVSVPPGDPGQEQNVVVTIDTHDSSRDPQILSSTRPLSTAVENGQVVDYAVTPVYTGSTPILRGITLSATGNSGFELVLTILNQAKASQ
jgi:hypothetical protein